MRLSNQLYFSHPFAKILNRLKPVWLLYIKCWGCLWQLSQKNSQIRFYFGHCYARNRVWTQKHTQEAQYSKSRGNWGWLSHFLLMCELLMFNNKSNSTVICILNESLRTRLEIGILFFLELIATRSNSPWKTLWHNVTTNRIMVSVVTGYGFGCPHGGSIGFWWKIWILKEDV